MLGKHMSLWEGQAGCALSKQQEQIQAPNEAACMYEYAEIHAALDSAKARQAYWCLHYSIRMSIHPERLLSIHDLLHKSSSES